MRDVLDMVADIGNTIDKGGNTGVVVDITQRQELSRAMLRVNGLGKIRCAI